MILINLLPHRELARKKRKESFQVSMLAAAMAGAAICGAIYLYYQYRIDQQEQRNTTLTNEIKALKEKMSTQQGEEKRGTLIKIQELLAQENKTGRRE